MLTFEDENTPGTCINQPSVTRIWTVTDNAGNTSQISQTITVLGSIAPGLGFVTGHIFNESNQMIENVEVHAGGSTISLMQLTLDDGYYEFQVPVDNNYEVEPVRNDNPLNGISTFDLILLSRHILGIELLDSPYKLIAADINNSGTISAFDLIELRKLILFIYTELPENPSWKFVDESYIFTDPTNPFNSTFPMTYSINNLVTHEVADFIGIKMGDLNESAIPK